MRSRAGLRQAEASILPSVSWVAKGQQPLETGWSHVGIILPTDGLRQYLRVCARGRGPDLGVSLPAQTWGTWGSRWGWRAPPSLTSCRCPVSKDACGQKRPPKAGSEWAGHGEARRRARYRACPPHRDLHGLVCRWHCSTGPHQTPCLTDGESSSTVTKDLLKVERGAPRPLARAPSVHLRLQAWKGTRSIPDRPPETKPSRLHCVLTKVRSLRMQTHVFRGTLKLPGPGQEESVCSRHVPHSQGAHTGLRSSLASQGPAG